MTPTFNQLVVALGAPDGDQALITYAALLARLGGSRTVRFVHVAEPSADKAAIRTRMRVNVAATAGDLGSRAEFDVLDGALSDRLLDYVTEFQADLVIIGAKRRKLGARLAMVAPCSVAILPHDVAATVTHLLVAFDFSADAAETLRWATSLVAADPAIRCTALHVMTHESTDLFAGHESAEAKQAAMEVLLSEANRHGVEVVPRLADVERSGDVGGGRIFSMPASIQGSDVAHTILEHAAACGADCIALSTRGRSRSASILLGSVTEKVIERAGVPLLIGKHAGRRLGLAEILLGRTTSAAGLKTN